MCKETQNKIKQLRSEIKEKVNKFVSGKIELQEKKEELIKFPYFQSPSQK